MSPLLKEVEDAGIQGMMAQRQPSRMATQDFFEPADQLRRLYAKLLDAPEPNRFAICPSVSYGLANVARNLSLQKGERILVVGEQFPSNIYPWYRVAEENDGKLDFVNPPDTLVHRGKKWNEEILHAIDEKTRMVALSHVHWADGTLFDLIKIREACDQVGACLVIDGTQSIGAFPFSIREIKPDALITAAYKWQMGPYAFGMAYYGPVFDQGIPIEENWINRVQSDDFANLVNYQSEYREQALRYEVGERSNFIMIPMQIAALNRMLDWGVAEIQGYAQRLSEPWLIQIRELGYHLEEPSQRASHLFGIRPKDSRQTEDLKHQLAKAGIQVSQRGDAIRVSIHVYNREDDMQRLYACLQHTAQAMNNTSRVFLS